MLYTYLILVQLLFATPKSFYELSANIITGESKKFLEYKNKVILIVNTASRCGFTSQYKDLQVLKLHFNVADFSVLGFPSNDFGGQEPGANAEIKKFCDTKFKITFTLFEKNPVSGKDIQPIFQWLTQEANPDLKGPILWNFEKFLINRQGKLIKRYRSIMSPSNPVLLKDIQQEVNRAPTQN